MSETCGGCVYDGVPLDGTSVRADPDGRIRLGGPTLATGYLGRPDLTPPAFQHRRRRDAVVPHRRRRPPGRRTAAGTSTDASTT